MKRYTKALTLITILLFTVTQCKNNGAGDSTGKINEARVIFAIGDVTVKTQSSWVTAQNQMKISQGAEIKTGSKSQCNVVIGKDSFVSVKEKSHLILEKILKDVSGVEENLLELKVGKSVLNPKKLLKGDSFRIKTPTAIAAVRGTKFIVEQNPGVKLKIAVVAGKVELKRRVPVLENIDKEVLEKSEALMSLKEKVEEETIVVDANESAFIDNKKAEEENRVISETVTEHVEVIKNEIEEVKEEKDQLKEDKIKIEDAKTELKVEKREPVVKQEKKIKNVLSTLSIMKKKNERKTAEITKQRTIEKKDVEDVKKFDKEITKAKTEKLVKVEKKEDITSLKISSPVKGSAIYVNRRFIGYDTALLEPDAGEKITIKIAARGYTPFVTEVEVKKGETRDVRAVMKKATRLVIVSPVPHGKIYVNNKYIGTGRAAYTSQAGEDLNVMVKAAGFDAYITSITLREGETKQVTAAMVGKARKGRVKWQQKLGKTISVKPIVYKNYLIIATNDGNLIMVNKNGRRIWKADLKRRIEATPLVYGNRIYIATSNGDFYSLKTGSGQIVWKKKIHGSLLFGAKPVVVGNNLYVATSFGRVYSFTLAGKETWHMDIENGIYSSPAVSKGTVYVGAEDQNIYALKTKDGSIKWTFKTDSRIVSSAPVVKGNTLYAGCYSGSFFAVNTATGKMKWRVKTGDSIFSTPLVKGNRVFIGSNDGSLYSINSVSGKVLWKYSTGNKVKSKPAAAGNLVIVTSGKNVYAVEGNSGKLQWRHAFRREIKTSASISGNSIFVGLDGGEIASVRNKLRDTYR